MDYKYQYGDLLRVDVGAYNEWWKSHHPQIEKTLQESQLPLKATGMSGYFDDETVRLEGNGAFITCPVRFVTGVDENTESEKIVIVIEIKSKLGDRPLIYVKTLDDMKYALASLIDDRQPFHDYDEEVLGEAFTIRFVEMIEAEFKTLEPYDE